MAGGGAGGIGQMKTAPIIDAVISGKHQLGRHLRHHNVGMSKNLAYDASNVLAMVSARLNYFGPGLFPQSIWGRKYYGLDV